MSDPLYTTDILRLAIAGAAFQSLDAPDVRADMRAPLCGSRIVLDLAVDDQQRVSAIGMMLSACAFGQASAALLAQGVTGRDLAAMRDAEAELAHWLADDAAPLPDWPDIAALAPARRHVGRHGAILLPFRAAVAALDPANSDVAVP